MNESSDILMIWLAIARDRPDRLHHYPHPTITSIDREYSEIK